MCYHLRLAPISNLALLFLNGMIHGRGKLNMAKHPNPAFSRLHNDNITLVIVRREVNDGEIHSVDVKLE